MIGALRFGYSLRSFWGLGVLPKTFGITLVVSKSTKVSAANTQSERSEHPTTMLKFNCKKFSDLTIEELYDAMALRQEVFVVEQDCPYLDADGKDQNAWHLLGYDEGQLLAYARIVGKGVSYEKYPSIGRVVISKKARGLGYGKLLMQVSLRECERLFGKIDIKISAQTYLLKFYNELGFQEVGEGYLEDNIPHIAMIYTAANA